MQYCFRQLTSVLGQSDDAASCVSALSLYCFCSSKACCSFSCQRILSTKHTCWIKFSSRSSIQWANSILSLSVISHLSVPIFVTKYNDIIAYTTSYNYHWKNIITSYLISPGIQLKVTGTVLRLDGDSESVRLSAGVSGRENRIITWTRTRTQPSHWQARSWWWCRPDPGRWAGAWS